jgi:hypothetical protein
LVNKVNRFEREMGKTKHHKGEKQDLTTSEQIRDIFETQFIKAVLFNLVLALDKIEAQITVELGSWV